MSASLQVPNWGHPSHFSASGVWSRKHDLRRIGRWRKEPGTQQALIQPQILHFSMLAADRKWLQKSRVLGKQIRHFYNFTQPSLDLLWEQSATPQWWPGWLHLAFTKTLTRNFPGGPVVKTPPSQCRGLRSNPSSRKIPHSMRHSKTN